MSLITEQQLQALDAARGAARPAIIILYGQLSRSSSSGKRSFLHRSSRKDFVVLDDTKLSCYESETAWRLGLSSSQQIMLDSINAVECSSTSIEIVYTSGWSSVQDKVKFTSSYRRDLLNWIEILPLCLPGSRSIRSFASELGLSLKSSVHDIIDAMSSSFLKIISVRSTQSTCSPSPRRLTRISSFYKRSLADHQFRAQVGGIQRLLQHHRLAMEKALIDEVSDKNNEEMLRRKALQVLWNVCSCPPLRSCHVQQQRSCTGCIIGAQKFLMHVARCESPDHAMCEGLLDVLLQRTANNAGDCQVRQPRAWPALFSVLASVSAENRHRVLRTINFLLIDNQYNCSTLATETRWQHMVNSAMIADRAGFDMIVALSLNILVMMSYYALMNTDNFISTINETLQELQVNDCLATTSVLISRIYLISLSNKISANMKSFSTDLRCKIWSQLIRFSEVVLRFMFRDVEGEIICQSRRRNSIKNSSIAKRLRHRQSVLLMNNYTELLCERDLSDANDDDVLLAEKVASLYEQLLQTIRDPALRVDLSRNPGIIGDAETIRIIFCRVAYMCKHEKKPSTTQA